MNIGAVARASKVSAKMIRYYEQIGLIPEPARSDSGYRAYVPTDVRRLQFVRRARDVGYTVAQIADLMALWTDQTISRNQVKQIAQAHLCLIERRMQDFVAMGEALRSLITHCGATPQDDSQVEGGQDGGVRVSAAPWDARRG